MNKTLFLNNNYRINLTNNLSKEYFEYNLLNFLYISYNNFFQFKIKNKKNIGLNKLLKKLFPIIINERKIILKFIDYNIIYTNKSIKSCIKNGLTYYMGLDIELEVVFYGNNKNDVINSKKEIINICNIPMMTFNGSFIIDGIEKVIVSKLVRSPGLYLSIEKSGKKDIYMARLIPDVGFEVDFLLNGDNLSMRIRRNEISLITVLKALGLDNNDIINEFYNFEIINILGFDNFKLKFVKEFFINSTFLYDIVNSLNEIIVPKNTIINSEDIINIEKNNIEYVSVDKNYLLNKFLANDVFNEENIKIVDLNTVINNNILNLIVSNKVKEIKLIHFSTNAHYCVNLSLIKNNLSYFQSSKALGGFFKKLNYSIFNKNLLEYKKNLINNCFFDISDICKVKLEIRFGKRNKNNYNYLDKIDLFNIIKLLISFKDNITMEDEKYNLNNLNLYLVGDVLRKMFFDFIINIKKNTNKKVFFLRKNINFSVKNFFNFKLLNLIIKNFFILSEYSQFLDQVNVLAELSHKRRISFFGILGVSRKYSGFNVRELNISHYSRLCPVETPEGINIGLVSALALFAGVDKNKFITAPYYSVFNRKIIKKIKYLNFDNENNRFIADSNFSFFKNYLKNEEITARFNEQFVNVNTALIDYIDVKNSQVLSVTSCLIPFLEYNDSNRALMAANMLKQALPCLIPEAPLVGTNFEKLIGINTNNVLVSKSKGIVSYIDSTTLIIKKTFKFKKYLYYLYDTYNLNKYIRSNQNTNITQNFIVNLNQQVFLNDILADNACTKNGEISLGQNMLTAFMSWGGYNFEDSIIVSEKVIIDERYTSLEILTIDVPVYNTDYGMEIITKNIYNYNNLDLNYLDDFGIIKTGSQVKSDDIVLGKKAPNSDVKQDKSGEEKLLHSIFLDEIENYIDTSYYLPKNISLGTVTNVEVLFSINYDLSEEDNKLLDNQVENYLLKNHKKLIFINKRLKKELFDFIINEETFFKKKMNKNLKLHDLLKVSFKNEEVNILYTEIKKKVFVYIKHYNNMLNKIKDKFIKNLAFNICKMVKITIIVKKILQVGDKLSGRHGNKGVISKILPVSEMPYLKNGKTIDVILNPLGITSRMNAGQLMEIHLGFASLGLSWKISKLLEEKNLILLKNLLKDIYVINNKNYDLDKFTSEEIIDLSNILKNGVPFGVTAFSKFNENDINYLLDLAFKDTDLEISNNKKQIYLYDGESGKKFERPITIGIMYILKLNHLVENKIHARSVGPYSLVTQQPLKGKSNLGGQRVGEMEVWALQAYGASYTLQEMITVKSDDVIGRFELYKNIIDGTVKFIGNKPESFNVMVKNVNSLGMYIGLS